MSETLADSLARLFKKQAPILAIIFLVLTGLLASSTRQAVGTGIQTPNAVAAVSSLAIDGTAQAWCPNYTSSCSTSLSTQHRNDVIIIFSIEELDLQSSCTFNISDTADLSWIARSDILFDGSGRSQLQEFWAVSVSPLSDDVITGSIIGCGNNYNSMLIFGITGANFYSPFDPNNALPSTATGYGGDTSVEVSTTNPDDMIFAAVDHGNPSGHPTAGQGFTIITQPSYEAAEYEVVNATVSNLSVTFDDPIVDGWMSMGDAVQAMPTTPDFAISANPSRLALPQSSSSASSVVTLTSLNGFSGTVSLTVSSPPAGFSTATQPSSLVLTPNGTAEAILTVDSTTNITTTFDLSVSGTSGSLSHYASVHVTANLQPVGSDFFLSTYPTLLTVLAGSSASSDIEVYPVGPVRTSFTVVFSVKVPAVTGLTATVSPSSVTLTPSPYQTGASVTLNVNTLATTPPGNYTITIVGQSGTFSHSDPISVQVLPPPALILAPPTGPVGTKVLVIGTGFPVQYGQTEILVTFDDQLLGFAFTSTGNFNFTFNVPVSQSGPHVVKATESLFTINGNNFVTTTAPFQVTGAPSGLSLILTVGTVYFPGDTAVANVLVTSGGLPVSSSNLQLTITLTRPDNTKVALNVTRLGSGLFMATYSLPKTALIGTYSLVATAHLAGTGDSSNIASFEVKLPWLTSQQPAIAGTAGVAALALVGVALVSWRKGYFRKSSKESY